MNFELNSFSAILQCSLNVVAFLLGSNLILVNRVFLSTKVERQNLDLPLLETTVSNCQ